MKISPMMGVPGNQVIISGEQSAALLNRQYFLLMMRLLTKNCYCIVVSLFFRIANYSCHL
jgi:hypothetical protein